MAVMRVAQEPTTPMSREELYARIMALPPGKREQAIALAAKVYGRKKNGPRRQGPPRDVDERRRYAGNAPGYVRDILGWYLTSQQEQVLDTMEAEDRVLIPAANAVGKSFILSAYAVYRMDAVGALPDDDRGLDEQGAQLLLPGPDHNTIFGTIYNAMLEHLRRALARGFGMPGEWSEKSVLWRVRPRWFVEAFAPPRHVGRDVAHTASGRHHRNQVAIIEEGQGVEEPIWKAVEGMCSSQGNKVISAFNPTEPRGSAYSRARGGSYRVVHLNAFGHPNVQRREPVVPAAISFEVIDSRVRTDCRDRGAYPTVQPDPERRDFLYALPPANAPERGPRTDGVPGHADGEVRVYRPSALFQGQVLGQWPDTTDSGLFDPAAWDAATARWQECTDPEAPPSRIGLDVAREGADDSVAMPAWGDSAEALLRAWAEARVDAELGSEAAAAVLLASRRVRVGQALVLAKGTGPQVAAQVAARWQRSPWNVDEGGVGASVLDHARTVLGMAASGVSFAAAPPEPTPGEPWSENLRTAMYVRAALLVARGLADVPPDPLLREEVLAHQLEHRARVVSVIGPDGVEQRERKPSVLLIAKDKIKKRIGRSPDRADAFVLALYEPPGAADQAWEVW